MFTIPQKLKSGDKIAVIAPANSLSIISEENRNLAINILKNKFGLEVVFSENALECDDFTSSSIDSRISDIHSSFSDKSISGILTAIGGYNSNQLLDHLDYDLIKSYPKIFCGYSDITALSGAILSRAGLMTYSGPHFSTFAMEKGLDYTLDYFHKCLFEAEPFTVENSSEWSDDKWYEDQQDRIFLKNDGKTCLNEGEAEGLSLGGNLNTFNLLQGTGFMPNLQGTILFLEDTDLLGDNSAKEFDRNLQSLTHLPEFSGVKGLVVGRFQKGAGVTDVKLRKIIENKEKLRHIPIIANLDFGHTTPQITFPVGGSARLVANKNGSSLTILRH